MDVEIDPAHGGNGAVFLANAAQRQQGREVGQGYLRNCLTLLASTSTASTNK